MPAQVADGMQLWLKREACDGFNVMFPFVPEGLDDVCGGLFRNDYEGTTLREHLGLARPKNRFFEGA